MIYCIIPLWSDRKENLLLDKPPFLNSENKFVWFIKYTKIIGLFLFLLVKDESYPEVIFLLMYLFIHFFSDTGVGSQGCELVRPVSYPWSVPPGFYGLVLFFQLGPHAFCSKADLKAQSSYICLQQSWDYKCAPLFSLLVEIGSQ
jgi:hypothetical protein